MRSLRRTVRAIMTALCCCLPLAAGLAQTSAASTPGRVAIQVGTGQVVTLPSAAANIFVADPKVAEVRPASSTDLFVFGIGAGRTSVAAMDAAGHLISQIEVTVQPSQFAAGEAQGAIARLIPGSKITVQAQIKGLLLSGAIDSPAAAAQAISIARGYLGENQTVENQLEVKSTIQVTLRVRIAEVSRQVVQNLGINWQALGTVGNIATFPALTLVANAAAAPACLAGPVGSVACRGVGFNGVIDALAQDNLAHVLAEPNLTVLSGQPASFLVGGEFPIPIGQQQGQVTIEFKKYGITLGFLPTVFSDGRINLHVSPEVSELTSVGAVQLSTGNSTIQIPALRVRRADTTVELGSGQSFAIAGLLMNNTSEAVSGLPFLKDIPILGSLFRSNAFQRNETELVVLVTPFIVRPVNNAAALHLPTDGFVFPTDLERVLLGRQTGHAPAAALNRIDIPGDAGFIMQ